MFKVMNTNVTSSFLISYAICGDLVYVQYFSWYFIGKSFLYAHMIMWGVYCDYPVCLSVYTHFSYAHSGAKSSQCVWFIFLDICCQCYKEDSYQFWCWSDFFHRNMAVSKDRFGDLQNKISVNVLCSLYVLQC